METVLGLIGLVVYIVVVVGLAAGVTWVVVKLSPSKSQKQLEAAQPKRREPRRGASAAQDVVERRVVEVVRLGDRLVRDPARRAR